MIKADADLKMMSQGELLKELRRVRKIIRTHKKKRDNARCWDSDTQLYQRTLPEGADDSGFMVLPREELLKNCAAYIDRQKRRSPCVQKCVLKKICKKK